jgi:hypothetical protein
VQQHRDLLVVSAERGIPGTEPELESLDPDSFTWMLSGAAQAQGAIAASPFTQSGVFTVPISLSNVTAGTTYEFTLSVSASEACGNDPADVLTAAWSTSIALEVVDREPGRR